MNNNKKCDMNVWALLLGALLLFVYFTNNLCHTRTEFFEQERGHVIEDAWAQLRERAETMYGRDEDVVPNAPNKVRFVETPASSSVQGAAASPSPPPPPASPSPDRVATTVASAPSPFARYLPYAAWTAQGDMRREWDRPQECATPAPAPAPMMSPPSATASPSRVASAEVPFPAGQIAAAMARTRAPTLAPSPIVTSAPTPQSPLTRMGNPSSTAEPSMMEYAEEDEDVEEI